LGRQDNALLARQAAMSLRGAERRGNPKKEASHCEARRAAAIPFKGATQGNG